MALPFLPLPEILKLTPRQLDFYFEKYAQHIPDAPLGRGTQYAIKVGTQTLYSDDTYELKQMFLTSLRIAKTKKNIAYKRFVMKKGKQR